VRVIALGWISAALLVVAFLGRAPQVVIWGMGGILLTSAYYLARHRPLDALALTAITALIGPICLFPLRGGLALHLGDLCLFVVAAVTILRIGPSVPITLGRRGGLLGPLLALVFVGWGLGLDPIASAPTMVTIAELVLIFWLTLILVRNTDDAHHLVAGWIGAVTLSSVLVIISYARGEPLILGAGELARERAGEHLLSETILFRASFFVTGFIFPLACAIVAASALILFPAESSSRARLVIGSTIAINVLALALMGNVTAAVGVAVGLACALSVLLLWPRGAYRAIGALIIGLVLGGVVMFSASLVMTSAQLQLLLGRASDNASFLERLNVWRNVVNYVLDAPHVALIGLGPDASIRLHDHPLLQSITRAGGLQQEAVDSGYMYLLLNYGFVVLGLVLVVACTLVADLLPAALTRRDFLAATVLCLLATWAVMSITQMHGVSKPAFMLMQLIAIGDIVPRSRHLSMRRGSTRAWG
jgi:hypothetical protein